MEDNIFKLNGFLFEDVNDYNEARQEAEIIEYIKANNDLEDYTKTLKLYHRLAEQNTLRTVVGLAFLIELQEKIINEGLISKVNIPCVRIVSKTAGRRTLFQSQSKKEGNPRDNIDFMWIKLRNTRIISLFLLIIIIVMSLMAIFRDRSLYTNYENKILNKYSSWEEDLDAREKALSQKE